MLLIVPYGIETEKLADLFSLCRLLIVPYGIETHEQIFVFFSCIKLLIVPYGIETVLQRHKANRTKSFNRTLWN